MICVNYHIRQKIEINTTKTPYKVILSIYVF